MYLVYIHIYFIYTDIYKIRNWFTLMEAGKSNLPGELGRLQTQEELYQLEGH